MAWNPNSDWPEAAYQPQQDSPILGASGCFAFGSAHPGSLNIAFCDGSVHQLAYDIDKEVHRHQANRLDGE